MGVGPVRCVALAAGITAAVAVADAEITGARGIARGRGAGDGRDRRAGRDVVGREAVLDAHGWLLWGWVLWCVGNVQHLRTPAMGRKSLIAWQGWRRAGGASGA